MLRRRVIGVLTVTGRRMGRRMRRMRRRKRGRDVKRTVFLAFGPVKTCFLFF
jgi:hypothetical protein